MYVASNNPGGDCHPAQRDNGTTQNTYYEIILTTMSMLTLWRRNPVVVSQRKTESHRHDVCQNSRHIFCPKYGRSGGPRIPSLPPHTRCQPNSSLALAFGVRTSAIALLNFFEISPLGTAGRSCSLLHNCRMTGVLGRWKLTQILKRCAPQGTGKWAISTVSLPCTQRC